MSQATEDRVALIKEATRLESQGEYEDAIVLYYKVLAHRPKDNLLRRRIGELCFLMGRVREGASQYMSIARIYEEAGFIPQAIACLRRARREAPEDFSVKVHLLSLYLILSIKVPKEFWTHGRPNTQGKGWARDGA